MAARISKSELIVVLVGIGVLVLMCLFPPWQKWDPERPLFYDPSRGGTTPVGFAWRSAGYRPIFTPPTTVDEHMKESNSRGIGDFRVDLDWAVYRGQIDVARLAVQFVAVTLGMAGTVGFMRFRRKDQAADRTTSA